MSDSIQSVIGDDEEGITMEGQRRLGERRDINTWEKRLFLWLMSILVLTCAAQIFEMNSNFRVVQSLVQINMNTNTRQDVDITALEKGHNQLRMGYVGQDFRLCNVEDILEIRKPRKKKPSQFLGEEQ